MVSEGMLVVTSILLAVTVSAVFFYYRRLKVLRYEYERAREVVEDIVVGVDTQFQRQKDRVLYVAEKIEAASLENKKVANRIDEYEGQLSEITKAVGGVPQIEERVSGQLRTMKKEVEDIKEAQNKVMQKLVEIEKVKQEAYVPEVKIEAAIPIKREKALEPLTETELMVLETIGTEGEKTAPEIREKIGLTREHTARLMKKLYKDGYLERDTHKMPYVYRLKEEMQKILKRREAKAS